MDDYKELETPQTEILQKKSSKLLLWLLLISVVAVVSFYFVFMRLIDRGEIVSNETFEIMDISSTENGDIKAVIRYKGYPKAISIKEWVEKEGIDDIASLEGSQMTLKIFNLSRKIELVEISSEEEVTQNK